MSEIPTIKWDGQGLQIDEYLMEHQIERPANEQVVEGWVTINGHHVLIGNDTNTPKLTAANKKELAHVVHDYFSGPWAYANGYTRTTSDQSKEYIQSGGEKGKGSHGAIIVDAIRKAPEKNVTLYRGLADTDLSTVKVGDIHSISHAASFTSSQNVADGFAHPTVGGSGDSHRLEKGWILKVTGAIKAIDVNSLFKPKIQEHEFISQGHFEVIKVDTDNKVLTMKQVGVY